MRGTGLLCLRRDLVGPLSERFQEREEVWCVVCTTVPTFHRYNKAGSVGQVERCAHAQKQGEGPPPPPLILPSASPAHLGMRGTGFLLSRPEGLSEMFLTAGRTLVRRLYYCAHVL